MVGRGGEEARARSRILMAAGLLLAFVLGLGLQLPAANGDRFRVADRLKYPMIAYNLVTHGAYDAQKDYGVRLARGESIPPYALRAPGYPFFLAAVFAMSPHFAGVDPQCLVTDRCPGATALRRDVQRVSAVVAALLVAATALVGGTMFGGWSAGTVAGVLMLVSVPDNDQSRLAALFLLGHGAFGVLAYRAVGRRRRVAFAAASGVLLAALILTRAVFQYWVLALFVFAGAQLVMQRRKCRDTGALATGMVVLVAVLSILPWVVRSHSAGGGFSVSGRRGFVLGIRAEYTQVTWPELVGGFAYYLPLRPGTMQELREFAMRALEPDVHGYQRFNRLDREGFYRRAKRQRGVVAARAREDPDWRSGREGREGRDAALGRAARDVILENWTKHLALSFVFGLRGSVVELPRFDLARKAYGNPLAEVIRRLTHLAEWAAIFHVSAMIASIAILGVRRDWSLLSFFLPTLYSFTICAGMTHYLPRYSGPLTPVWTVGLVFAGGELLRAVRRAIPPAARRSRIWPMASILRWRRRRSGRTTNPRSALPTASAPARTTRTLASASVPGAS